jgi:phage gp29-like protein
MATLVPYGGQLLLPEDAPQEDMTPPQSLVPFKELPVYGAPPPDRKWIIDAIVRELDNGQFINAGKLGDSILRDARIRGAFEQRLAGLFGAPFEMEAADDSTKAGKIAEDLEKLWPRMFPRAALEELHRYGITQGIGIAEKIWDTTKRPWTFRIKVWHPQFYYWLWTTRSYYVVTYDRGLVRVPEKSTKWIVYTPYGYERAFLLGNLRALLDPWMFRSWNKSDWGNYNEIYGKPIRQAIVPQTASTKEEQRYVDSVAKMGANTVVKSKQDKDGNKYAVELIEAKSTGYKTFPEAIAWCNEEIAQVLLGQTMSMDGQGGLGSQEEPGKAVRADIRASDNEKLTECLLEQGIREFVEYNYGNPDLAPYPCYLVDPPDDEVAESTADMNRANASNVRIQAGIVTPEEEAIALATGQSVGEVIDVESRKRIQAASVKEMEQQAKNDLEAAKDPQPTPGETNRQQQAQPQEPFGGDQ